MGNSSQKKKKDAIANKRKSDSEPGSESPTESKKRLSFPKSESDSEHDSVPPKEPKKRVSVFKKVKNALSVGGSVDKRRGGSLAMIADKKKREHADISPFGIRRSLIDISNYHHVQDGEDDDDLNNAESAMDDTYISESVMPTVTFNSEDTIIC